MAARPGWVKPSNEIGELWDGMFDWLDDYQQGWTFEKLYPLTDKSELDLISGGTSVASAKALKKPF